MFMKRLIPVALTSLLFSCPLALAEETAGQPAQGGTEAGAPAAAAETGQAQETAGPASGMEMGSPGMMGGPGMIMGAPGAGDKSQGMAMEPGMQGAGKEGCHMGKGGKMGMMHGGPGGDMGKGGMMGGCRGQAGVTQQQYRELIGRLDRLDARMAKIDIMLEKLLER